ncbi:hypothetical protein, conserved [Leishmania tarentolae]|uniref:LisH domain-containing protein n=1 Tax=Leishmania tarentolae TaxID=5689 RepID=A0A640KQ55_LEITA|nr:hypothetical protein, conserved [Leishmania tarentolae]
MRISEVIVKEEFSGWAANKGALAVRQPVLLILLLLSLCMRCLFYAKEHESLGACSAPLFFFPFSTPRSGCFCDGKATRCGTHAQHCSLSPALLVVPMCCTTFLFFSSPLPFLRFLMSRVQETADTLFLLVFRLQDDMDEFRAGGATHIEEGSEANAALLQLQDAFVSALTASGTLGKIRAQLRASALALIRGDDELQNAAVGPFIRPATLNTHAKVSLLLLYDFLQHYHLQQTAGVLDVESSVHLLVNERATLLGELAQLPGDGPLLERLLRLYEPPTKMPDTEPPNASAVPIASKATPGVPAAETPALTVACTTSSASDEETTALAEPHDADVLYELDKYEDSIPFSDTEGPLDAAFQCDEVERLMQ